MYRHVPADQAVGSSTARELADSWITTSIKPFNFVQHVKTLLKQNGRTAVVAPDKVLFFDKKPVSETPGTKGMWIYDLRTALHFTLKTNPLRREDLNESFTAISASRQTKPRPCVTR